MGEWEGMPVSQWHRLEEHLKGVQNCLMAKTALTGINL